jgi:hypothetical protein
MATLQIIANLYMSFISFNYIETYSVNANIFVSTFLISTNIFLLLHSRKKHIYSSTLILPYKVIFSIPIVIGLFLLLCLKSFFLIRYFSILDTLYQSYQLEHGSTSLVKIIVLSIFLCCVLCFQIYLYYKKIMDTTLDKEIKKLVEQYQLDFSKTYFFTLEGSVTGFKTGQYTYRLGEGLFDGKRFYLSSVVLDYLNIMGINFNDLDEGHVKNIEMYGISS